MTHDAWLEELQGRAQRKGLALSDDQLQVLLETLAEAMLERLDAGESFELPGVGRFVARELEGRRGINPKSSGGEIWIESEKVVEFKADRSVLERLQQD